MALNTPERMEAALYGILLHRVHGRIGLADRHLLGCAPLTGRFFGGLLPCAAVCAAMLLHNRGAQTHVSHGTTLNEARRRWNTYAKVIAISLLVTGHGPVDRHGQRARGRVPGAARG